MGKGRYERSRPKSGACRKLLPVLALLLLAGAVLCGFLFFSGKKTAQTPNGILPDQMGTGEKNPNSIAIPGYEGVTLAADTRVQTVGFPNPSQNSCYFQITLSLEDGTKLWQSNLVEPGAVSDPILLTQPLSKGTYPNAVLRFDCFAMNENRSALNGAETKLTLWVK